MMHCSLCLECEVAELNQTKMLDVTIDSFVALTSMTSSILDSLNFLKLSQNVQELQGLLDDCVGISVTFEVLLDDGTRNLCDSALLIVELFISIRRYGGFILLKSEMISTVFCMINSKLTAAHHAIRQLTSVQYVCLSLFDMNPTRVVSSANLIS